MTGLAGQQLLGRSGAVLQAAGPLDGLEVIRGEFFASRCSAAARAIGKGWMLLKTREQARMQELGSPIWMIRCRTYAARWSTAAGPCCAAAC